MTPSMNYSYCLHLSSQITTALTLLPPSYEDPRDHTGPNQKILDNLPISISLITDARSLYHVRKQIHRLWGLGCGYLWGAILLSTTCLS